MPLAISTIVRSKPSVTTNPQCHIPCLKRKIGSRRHLEHPCTTPSSSQLLHFRGFSQSARNRSTSLKAPAPESVWSISKHALSVSQLATRPSARKYSHWRAGRRKTWASAGEKLAAPTAVITVATTSGVRPWCILRSNIMKRSFQSCRPRSLTVLIVRRKVIVAVRLGLNVDAGLDPLIEDNFRRTSFAPAAPAARTLARLTPSMSQSRISMGAMARQIHSMRSHSLSSARLLSSVSSLIAAWLHRSPHELEITPDTFRTMDAFPPRNTPQSCTKANKDGTKFGNPVCISSISWFSETW
mmetsp:Transcript_26907/g.60714  ORF Transcript_26907/g.60714 Transcript_26907/m.60714 type:complete len:299 (-) Transcript_26907:951-1847(-)